MNEQERKALVSKILDVEKDPKASRAAASVFINGCTEQEATVFLQYLNHENREVVKIVRKILGQMGVKEAIEPLTEEFLNSIGALTFLPDAEYKENNFYINLIEILESIYPIMLKHEIKNDELLKHLDEIFKKTGNEDLRFSLMKIMGYLGDRFNYFMQFYDKFSPKEKRALYLTYSMIEAEGRGELFERGLQDSPNFDFVLHRMLGFHEGRVIINKNIGGFPSSSKQTLLQKLLDDEVYEEFLDSLIDFLNDDNNFIVDLSKDCLKKGLIGKFPVEKFREFIETGYTPTLVNASIELMSHFVTEGVEDLLLEAFEKQALYTNKSLVLEELFARIKKGGASVSLEFSKRLLAKVLEVFDNYSEEKEPIYISVLKILTHLKYGASIELKNVKIKVLAFARDNQNSLTKPLQNNFNEAVVRINSLIAKIEGSEKQLKDITQLFDLPPEKIEAERITTLNEQLDEIELIDDKTKDELLVFMDKLFESAKHDWKKRGEVVKILGEYCSEEHLGFIKRLSVEDSSLGVRVSAAEALKKLRERLGVVEEKVLIAANLFYINKLINDYFEDLSIDCETIQGTDITEYMSNTRYSHIFLSDALFDEESFKKVLEYMNNTNCKLIIITANVDKFSSYLYRKDVKLLGKPFNREKIQRLLGEF